MSSVALTEWVNFEAVKSGVDFYPSRPPLIPGEELLSLLNQNLKGYCNSL